VKTKSPDYTMR